MNKESDLESTLHSSNSSVIPEASPIIISIETYNKYVNPHIEVEHFYTNIDGTENLNVLWFHHKMLYHDFNFLTILGKQCDNWSHNKKTKQCL